MNSFRMEAGGWEWEVPKAKIELMFFLWLYWKV
jgi:hypothetical protein